MKSGIYIMANDKTIEQSIALLNSIRFYDKDVPIMLIPYDNKHKKIIDTCKIELFPDLKLIEQIENRVNDIFPSKLFARPQQFRKQACWFGPFEEFLYLDTDIVVFEKIIENLKYLKEHDFVYCDYQYKQGIKNIFTPKIFSDEIFTNEDIEGVFNAGFWGSKKGVITEEDLYSTFEECAEHPEYFDFSQKVSDMPVFNYMVLRNIERKFNIVRAANQKGAGSWAGMPHFVRDGNRLIDPKVNQPLKYLHWAGIKIEPGCPYWDVWEYYRFMNDL